MQLLRGRTTRIDSLAISPDSRYLAVGGAGGCHVWDLHDPKLSARSVAGGDKTLVQLRFTSATELFACIVNDAWHRYDLDTGAVSRVSLPRGGDEPWAIVYPDGTLLKAVDQWGGVETFRITEAGIASVGAAVRVDGTPRLVGFDPSGRRYLASALCAESSERRYHLFDSATDTPIHTLEFDRDDPLDEGSFSFSPDGRYLYAMTLWHLHTFDCDASGTPVATCVAPDRSSYRCPLATHPDGRILASVENAVNFRDAATLQVTRTYDFNIPKVTCVAFTPDGTRCVVGNSRGKVLLFDVD